MSAINPSKYTKKIKTAVEFLAEVHEKKYSESILKKYLIEKRNLTPQEVEAAFEFHKNRIEAANKEKQGTQTEKDKERAERPSNLSSLNQYRDVSFILPSKQSAGTKLINTFLVQEQNYCNILKCLEKEYHVQLARYAYQNMFQMSRREVEEIFIRIPGLLKFHNGFFLDLKRGSNIGRMFVQLFKFFEGYAEYMRDCQLMVNKMRKYIQDARFYACLIRIKEESSRKNDDMFDLLLYPLNRILHYRSFLNNLFAWADKTQTTDYELLGKASRRIGRVSTYIEKYKYGICNQNEMNKVQKFLRDQCDILAPERHIVRRGMMIRRTSGWRNKQYVFFLFNDMLLWTNKNGTLQNALQLRSCEVMPSSAKNYAHRKFEVVYRSEKHKTLRLECDSLQSRNDWFEAIKRTITAAKLKYSEAWSRSEALVTAKYSEYPDNLSDEEGKTLESTDVSRCDTEDDSKSSTQLDDPENKRYHVTSSFRIQEFKEIDPMDDNVSQISEQDVAFHQERRKYLPESGITGASRLSPFEKVTKNHARESSDSVVITQNTEKSNRHNGSDSAVIVQKNSPSKEQDEDIKQDSVEFFNKGRKSSIVRTKSNSGSIARTETSPKRFTIRLDGF